MVLVKRSIFWFIALVLIFCMGVATFFFRDRLSLYNPDTNRTVTATVKKISSAGVERGSGPEAFSKELLVIEKRLPLRQGGAWAPDAQTARELAAYKSLAIPSFRQEAISARIRHIRILEPRQTNESLPVVILLHGAGRDSISILDVFRQAPSADQFILIAPESEIKGWSLQIGPNTLDAILSHIPADIDFDENRIFVFGHSAGGGLSSTLAQATDHKLRAIATHGGLTDAQENSQKPKCFQEPMRIYVGEMDEYFSPQTALRVAQGYAKKRHKIEVVTIPDHNHWFYIHGPEIAENALQWFVNLEFIPLSQRIDPTKLASKENPKLLDVIIERWQALWG